MEEKRMLLWLKWQVCFLSCFCFTILSREFFILCGVENIFSVIPLKLFSIFVFSAVLFSGFSLKSPAVGKFFLLWLLEPSLTDNKTQHNTRLQFCFHVSTIIRTTNSKNVTYKNDNQKSNHTPFFGFCVYKEIFKLKIVCMK